MEVEKKDGLAGPPFESLQPLPLWKVSGLLAAAVSVFSLLWTRGALVIDGHGNSLYVRLAHDYLLKLHRVPYWVPEMWAGTPVWALGPSFPVLLITPLSLLVGPDVAVKLAILGLQIAGGIGAYVLARSMWGAKTAPIVAGVVYALHPMIVAHAALAGAMGAMGVTAVTPWMAWSLRRALRGDAMRYVIIAGLLAAFAVLQQAEYALGLVLLCIAMGAVELSAARRTGAAVRSVAARGAAVVGIALGAVAHWLLPFMALGKSFILSPPELVENELTIGLAGQVGREIGLFFHRPGALEGIVSFNRSGLIFQSFYLGWVCLALTAASIVLLARRRGDAHLSAILLASGFAVWLSTGAIPLASSGPALRGQWLPLAIAGGLAGLMLGGFVRRLQLRKTRILGLVVPAALVVMLAYIAPYVALQRAIPLLAEIRFPRFYMLAALGLALGTAYPLTLVESLLLRKRTRYSGPVVMRALTAVLLVAFAIDIFPLASHYRLQAPHDRAAYAAVADELSTTGETARVAPSTGDPRSVTGVLRAGASTSIGWPHPVAGRQLWRVTIETYGGPQGYREAALGLSATAFVAAENRRGVGGPKETVEEVELLRNPRSLPLVRSYEQAVVVAEPDLAPLLAVSLAHRNVGVVTDRGESSPRLGAMPTARIGSAEPCAAGSTPGAPAILSGEVALACSIDRWIDRLLAGTELFPIDDRGTGARFVSGADGLRGVAVWLDRGPDRAELALREVGGDGRSLGPVLARGQAIGLDEYGLTTFTFDPIAGSAGRTFVFSLTCGGCDEEDQPRMVTGVADKALGDMVLGGSVRTDRVGAFSPIHDRLPAATVPGTRVTAQRTGPGSWKVGAEGPNPALLVVAETWFPGWRAKIDGRDAPVLQADGAFLGVAIPAGRHEVTFSYGRPPAAVVGRLITFATLGGLVWAVWRRRRPQWWRRSPPKPVKAQSAADGDALKVSAPSVKAPGQQGLQPGQARPRPTVAGRQRPRRK